MNDEKQKGIGDNADTFCFYGTGCRKLTRQLSTATQKPRSNASPGFLIPFLIPFFDTGLKSKDKGIHHGCSARLSLCIRPHSLPAGVVGLVLVFRLSLLGVAGKRAVLPVLAERVLVLLFHFHHLLAIVWMKTGNAMRPSPPLMTGKPPKGPVSPPPAAPPDPGGPDGPWPGGSSPAWLLTPRFPAPGAGRPQSGLPPPPAFSPGT